MTGFFLCDQPVLSLYAAGKITGTVVDLGHSKTGVGTENAHHKMTAHVMQYVPSDV